MGTLRTLACALVFGLLLACLSAWASAALGFDPRDYGTSPSVTSDQFDSTDRAWVAAQRPLIPGYPWARTRDRARFGYSWRAYSQIIELPHDGVGGATTDDVILVRAGFPFYAAQCRAMSPTGSGAGIKFAEAISLPWPARQAPVRPLPLTPIWSGLLADAAIFGVVGWSLSLVASAWVRRRRVNRGVCPSCRYQLGESRRCAECGWQKGTD
ncbi:MAG: hypothetical protein SGJ09_03485 [Phycisphaerae bacterium]|nr:hypothetical protein [Phycisphaerae bacterium]